MGFQYTFLFAYVFSVTVVATVLLKVDLCVLIVRRKRSAQGI